MRAVRLALRDLRGGLGSLLLFWLCLAISVASIAAVGSLAASIESALAANGRELLGADLVLTVAQREATPEEEQAIRALGPTAKSINLRSSVVTTTGESALADVAGVDGRWPPAGSVEMGAGRLPSTGEIAIGAELAERLALRPGDMVRVGFARFRISGVIRTLPSTLSFAFAPPAVLTLDGMRSTGLIQPGSLTTTSYRVVTAPGADPAAVGEAHQRRFAQGGWRATDRSEAAAGTRRTVERLEQLLMLIGLTGLAIGGLGISSAAAAFAASRQRTIATLKLLGARRGTIRAMLAVELGLITGLALIVGLAAGAVAPGLAAEATRDWLPVSPDPSVQPLPLLQAALFGILVTIAAAAGPVSDAAATRPAELFRQMVDQPMRSWRRFIVPALAVLAAVALAVASTANAWFTLSAAGALAGLALVFAGLGWLLRRWARRPALGLGPVPRLGIAALARPGSATVRLSVALGLGLALLAMLSTTGASLLKEIQTSIPGKAPALFLVDIPVREQARFRAMAERTLPGSELVVVPTLRGSVTAINGTRVIDMKEIPEGAWMLRGDRGLTFLRALPAGNEIVAGDWWPADYSGPPLVSIDVDAATALDLEIGDRMTIAVLGRPIEARIASFRRIDWRSYGFNFAIIFAPGALEQAPYTMMAKVAPPAGESPLPLERALTRDLPMVSAIRVSDIIVRVRETLQALEGAVWIATGLAIVIGIVVLAGSVAATQRARRKDMVLLKLIGATRLQALSVQAIEFALLSLAVALAAVGAGALAAWAVLRYLLELDFAPGWQALAGPPAAAVLLSVAAALLAALPALLARPATALRSV